MGDTIAVKWGSVGTRLLLTGHNWGTRLLLIGATTVVMSSRSYRHTSSPAVDHTHDDCQDDEADEAHGNADHEGNDDVRQGLVATVA
jgi:hypothetical protein